MKRYFQYLPILLCILLTFFCISCFRISYAHGASMEPTYHTGDILIVQKYFGQPKVGDVALIYHEDSAVWLKRVAAVSGQTVNGITIPPGSVYVLGDNPRESYDSRDPNVGPIPQEECWGKVILHIPRK